VAGVIPNSGENLALELLVNKGTSLRNLVLKLFQNNVTPGETDTASTYTEADFTGYSAVTLTGSSWALTPGAPSQAVFAQQTFTSSADQSTQNVYGYYLVTDTDGTLVAAERFSDGPYQVANNGDAIKVTPIIRAS